MATKLPADSLPMMTVQRPTPVDEHTRRSQAAKAADSIVSEATFESAKAEAGKLLSEVMAKYTHPT